MLVAIAFIALQTQKLGPTLPPSCSQAFQATVISLESSLQDQDFVTAKKRLKLLPRSEISVEWDESKVPAGYRAEFQQARNQALEAWNRRINGLQITVKPKGDIKISFEPELAIRPDTGLPAARVGFFGENSDRPRLDFVIGLKRGRPLQTTGVNDVYNDVQYSIGMYLGISDGLPEANVMGETDLPRDFRTKITTIEADTARENLNAVTVLAKATDKKTPLLVAKPDLFLPSHTLQLPHATQGDSVEIELEVTNRGTGPLSFRMMPDCGCTAVTEPGTIDPQSTRILKALVDTKLFISDMLKHIVLYTNDPVTPVTQITIKIPLHPKYRLLGPNDGTIVVPKSGKKAAIYLIPTNMATLEPISFKFDGVGVHAKVSMERFHGMLADPDMNEGLKMRTGYKYVVDVKGDLPPGRSYGTLQIFTSNSDFPNMTYPMWFQDGIVILPGELHAGLLGRVPKSMSFLVTAPGMPFKVLGVTSNAACLSAKVSSVKSTGDFKVEVFYDGKGKPGELLASIKVLTNNPAQPILYVPFRANIQ